MGDAQINKTEIYINFYFASVYMTPSDDNSIRFRPSGHSEHRVTIIFIYTSRLCQQNMATILVKYYIIMYLYLL